MFLIGSDEAEAVSELNQSDERPEWDDIKTSGLIGTRTVNGTQIAYFRENATLSFPEYDWEFDFENLPFIEMQRNYTNIVNIFLKRKCVSLDQVFRSRTLSIKLRDELRRITGGEVNRTSVVMSHGPITNNDCIASSDLFHISRKHTDCCYSLLTGDITLSTHNNNSISLFCKHPYSVIQYPHHGAEENMILAYFNKNALYVISCGLCNRYGHPHPSLVRDLRRFILVDERRAWDYHIMVIDKHNMNEI